MFDRDGPTYLAAMSAAGRMHHATAGAPWSNPARAPTWKEGLTRMIPKER